MSDKNHNVKLSLPAEWAVEKLLGPTLNEIGKDLASLYRVGVEKISKVALRKTTNIDDGAKANLRVARDVFLNGSFSDEQISAEYFGGILAASRSADGKDDRAVFFLGIIKSMSSSQLKLHYLIYSSFNRLLIQDGSKKQFNPARSEQVGAVDIYFLSTDIKRIGINMDADFLALNNKGLITDFEYSSDIDPDNLVHISRVKPTSLGVQLYAISCNKFDEWRNFATTNLNTFEVQERPLIVSDNPEELLNFPLVQLAKDEIKLKKNKQ